MIVSGGYRVVSLYVLIIIIQGAGMRATPRATKTSPSVTPPAVGVGARRKQVTISLNYTVDLVYYLHSNLTHKNQFSNFGAFKNILTNA